MNGAFSAERLIGVIDLKTGRAVRAIAGKRESYASFEAFLSPSGLAQRIDGDAVKLAACFARSGIQSLYIADLDAIQGRARQIDLIEIVLAKTPTVNRVFLDLGIRGDETRSERDAIARLVQENQRVHVIVATETLVDLNQAMDRFAFVFPHRIALSLDYRNGNWVSRRVSEAACIDWVNESKIAAVVALDIAGVGTSSLDRTRELCKRLRHRIREAEFITGGGIETAGDIDLLRRLGADHFLVASMFARRCPNDDASLFGASD